MAQKRKSKKYLLVGAVAGFLSGICGNLIAAWIQQDVISNSFSPLRVGIIILCSLVGIFVMTILESKINVSVVKERLVNEKSKNSYSRIRLAWSKLRTRGKDIKMDDVSAFSSDIDIDSK